MSGTFNETLRPLEEHTTLHKSSASTFPFLMSSGRLFYRTSRSFSSTSGPICTETKAKGSPSIASFACKSTVSKRGSANFFWNPAARAFGRDTARVSDQASHSRSKYEQLQVERIQHLPIKSFCLGSWINVLQSTGVRLCATLEIVELINVGNSPMNRACVVLVQRRSMY